MGPRPQLRSHAWLRSLGVGRGMGTPPKPEKKKTQKYRQNSRQAHDVVGRGLRGSGGGRRGGTAATSPVKRDILTY